MTIRSVPVLTALALAFLGVSSSVAQPRVVATIPPIHSLASLVMEGVATPKVLLTGSESPHRYTLKPSQSRALSEAEVVFRVDESFETFMNKPLKALAGQATVVSLINVPGVKLLKWQDEHDDHSSHKNPDAHKDHDDHKKHGHKDHDDHKKHGHKDHDAHKKHGHKDHDDHKKDGHKEHADKGHDHHDHGGEYDIHIWLDTRNAIAMVKAIAKVLSTKDAENSVRYKSNADRAVIRLQALNAEVKTILKPVQRAPFMNFHDAWQYFNAEFSMNYVGALTLNPEAKPGARRIAQVQKTIRESGAKCLFAEPQFPAALAQVAVRGTPAKIDVIDPIGAYLTPGPDLYFDLMRQTANEMASCLGRSKG